MTAANSRTKGGDGHRPPLYLSLGFLNQADFRNLHLFVNGLAHIVDREQCDGDAGERFHLDARLRDSSRGALYFSVIL